MKTAVQCEKETTKAPLTAAKENSSNSPFYLVDNRPEAVAHKKLQDMANYNPQVKQLITNREMAGKKVHNDLPVHSPKSAQKSSSNQVVQRVLMATPTSDATENFVKLVNKILKGSARIILKSDNTFNLQQSGTNEKTSPEAKKLLEVLHKIISAPQRTAVKFASSDPEVFIGGFDQESIDLTDVGAFGVNPGKQMGPGAASMLVHELEEQFRKQVHHDDIDKAHGDHAIPAEEKAVSGFREGSSPKEYTDDEPNDYSQKFKYSYLDGSIVIVNVTVKNSNVTNVERAKYKNYTAWKDSPDFMEQMNNEELPEIKVGLLEKQRILLQKEYDNLLTYNHSKRTQQKRALYKQKIRDVQARLSSNKKLLEFERNLAKEMEDDTSSNHGGDTSSGSGEDSSSGDDD